MSALDLLTQLDSSRPLSLGQVTMNAEGVLEMRQAPPLQQAQFRWHDVPVSVRLHKPEGSDDTICDIVADLGPVPFSAQNPELRALLLAVMRGFRPPIDSRVLLGPRQHLWMTQQTHIHLPLNPASVLAEVAVFLKRMGPVIALVRDLQRSYEPAGQGRAARLKPLA
jgi:hypothetical protein